jgi:hypothetical protein
MTVSTRRRITRVSLAIDLAAAAAIVIRASPPGFHTWTLGLTSLGASLVSILAGLAYLRSSRRRS